MRGSISSLSKANTPNIQTAAEFGYPDIQALAALADEGLVTVDVVEREERLDIKLYHITKNGCSELYRWLSTSLPPQDYREPHLIQVVFGGNLTDEELLNLWQHEAQSITERLAAYAGTYAAKLDNLPQANDPRAFFLSLLTLEYDIMSNNVALAWLRSVIERLQVGDNSPADLATLRGDSNQNNV
jgi:DNA-binding PadR family transcriptional regulator